MKKALLTITAVMGLSLGAFGQGAVNVDNSTLADGSITLDIAGNYFAGIYGLEVWVKNGTSQPLAPINSLAGAQGSAVAYGQLTALGFTKEATFLNRNNTGNDGIVNIGQVNMADVSPAGSTVTIALAGWLGSGSSFLGASKGGVVAFYNATADYTQVPAPTPPTITGWDAANTDLILVTVPEPGTLAIAGLGLVSLLALRRRK